MYPGITSYIKVKANHKYKDGVLDGQGPQPGWSSGSKVGDHCQQKDKEFLPNGGVFVWHKEHVNQADEKDGKPYRVKCRWYNMTIRILVTCWGVCELQENVRFVSRVSNEKVPVVLLDAVLSYFTQMRSETHFGLSIVTFLNCSWLCKCWLARSEWVLFSKRPLLR